MKKQFFFAAATVLAFAFTSCKKYEVSAPLDIAELPTVQVSGTLFAQLDDTKPGLETVPSGVQVLVRVDIDEYNPDNNSNDYHIISTQTNANGAFSINVPVTAAGIDANISFETFTYDKLDSIGITDSNITKTQYELDDISLKN